jgi:hypothetical protein
MLMEKTFRKLRAAWFDNHLAIRQEQRVWETEDDEAERLRRNAEYRKRFDADTEKLLAQEPVPDWRIAPYCLNDLTRES